MRQNWKTVICFLVAITMTALLVINGQKQSTNEDQPDVTQFPTVDYQNRKPVNSSEKQRNKSKKYNSRYAPVITEASDTIFLTSDWDLRLPALPVARSSAVIIGEITNAQAQLSDDQTKIYSEFVVQINEILKNDDKAPLGVGNSVVVERAGGRVRFPSGKIVVSSTNHQDLPHFGKRYLLFLNHDSPNGGDSEDFTILTGYELRDGRVFPLDKPGLGHPILAYKGTSEISLLNDLVIALANPSDSQSK
jgi:hypothetical protein